MKASKYDPGFWASAPNGNYLIVECYTGPGQLKLSIRRTGEKEENHFPKSLATANMLVDYERQKARAAGMTIRDLEFI